MKAELISSRLCDEGMYEEAENLDKLLDTAWAAGVIEGEGCLSMFDRKCPSGNIHPQFAIHCEMTDQDIIVRLQHCLGGRGNINCRENNRRSDGCERKPSWILSIQKQQEVCDTLNELWEWFGDRRRAKAQEILDVLEKKGVVYEY